MADTSTKTRKKAKASQTHFDVLIAGAGISGVGAAWHMKHQCPDKSFAVLEAQDSFGGTWRTHTYPGIRSDSDLYTFGYRFKPWRGNPIATAEQILGYMREVIDENDIEDHIRYGHKIISASWSSQTKLWTVRALQLASKREVELTANFVWMCQGYYEHAEGYTPKWTGMEDFKGPIIHPQTWPDDLDIKDKRVVLIGSGATAATVVPAIADQCAHVTMVQRSPTFFIPGRNANELADTLRQLQVDEAWIHEITRRKVLYDQEIFTQRAMKEPETVRQELYAGIKAIMGEDYELAPHFTPSYRPWQQRIAFVPEGDLFAGLLSGKASVETSEIERFTPKGLLLRSGKELEADIIITATGFHLSVMGGIPFEVDGAPVDFADTITYRGMMFTGVPNLLWIFGYFRASWTLRVDILADFTCRLLKHMDAKGAREVTVKLRPEDHNMEILPWLDEDNFNPGYMKRGGHLLPKRGNKRDWQHTQDYWREKDEIPLIDLDGAEFEYKP